MEDTQLYFLCLELVYDCVKNLDRENQLKNINHILKDIDKENPLHVCCGKIAKHYKYQELCIEV